MKKNEIKKNVDNKKTGSVSTLFIRKVDTILKEKKRNQRLAYNNLQINYKLVNLNLIENYIIRQAIHLVSLFYIIEWNWPNNH